MKKYIIGAIVGAILSGIITYTLKSTELTKVSFSKIDENTYGLDQSGVYIAKTQIKKYLNDNNIDLQGSRIESEVNKFLNKPMYELYEKGHLVAKCEEFYKQQQVFMLSKCEDDKTYIRSSNFAIKTIYPNKNKKAEAIKLRKKLEDQIDWNLVLSGGQEK